MEVLATKDGSTAYKFMRKGEGFDFSTFEINPDGTHNLGSWMRPTEKGLKQIAAMEKELGVKMRTKAEAVAAEADKAAELEAENADLKATLGDAAKEVRELASQASEAIKVKESAESELVKAGENLANAESELEKLKKELAALKAEPAKPAKAK